jgi:hypothetical protein
LETPPPGWYVPDLQAYSTIAFLLSTSWENGELKIDWRQVNELTLSLIQKLEAFLDQRNEAFVLAQIGLFLKRKKRIPEQAMAGYAQAVQDYLTEKIRNVSQRKPKFTKEVIREMVLRDLFQEMVQDEDSREFDGLREALLSDAKPLHLELARGMGFAGSSSEEFNRFVSLKLEK